MLVYFFSSFLLQLVYPNGAVCISILHPPGDDPNHYEHASERWSPIQSVEKILISVMSMLAEPNDESPANVEAAKMWRERKSEYEKRVRDEVRRGLGLWIELKRFTISYAYVVWSIGGWLIWHGVLFFFDIGFRTRSVFVGLSWIVNRTVDGWMTSVYFVYGTVFMSIGVLDG